MRYISRLPLDSPLPWPRRVAIMGSTGSIGVNTLRVLDAWAGRLGPYPAKKAGEFIVTALAGGRNIALLAAQAERWRPPVLALRDADGECGVSALKQMLPPGYRPEILVGQAGFAAIAARDDVDVIVSAQVGAAGLRATVAAAEAGKVICLANKESLVLAGPLIRSICARTGAVILPVDSEHNALFQCMTGRAPEEIRSLVLTASGGPFRGKTREELRSVRPEHALRHPNWSMGAKITIDSATLMNKGLEVIDAKWLYGVDYDKIQVVVHPQSIIHSMVQFCDGSVIAQLGCPDMKLPIQYALTYPTRQTSTFERLDFWKLKDLTFEKPDTDTFKGLRFAYEAGKMGGSMPCVFNAANEVAVGAFLKDAIHFLDIYDIIEETMMKRECIVEPTLEELFEEDKWARAYAASLLAK